MTSIVRQKADKIAELTEKIILLEESFTDTNEDNIAAARRQRANGYATIIVEAIVNMLTEASGEIKTVTTSASGTWPSMPEPASASGIHIQN